MSFNPFNEKPINFDSSFVDWSKIYPVSYDKYDVDPYTKLRTILMNGTEFEAVWFNHQFFRNCTNNDIRRELANTRRVEQQQQKRIACIKPINESILEHTIGYEQLAVDLTAILAQREKDLYVKAALDFALLEDFDHLYRFSNLLDTEHSIHAERLVGSYTEIFPGRPTISEHRYPFDDVKRPIDNKIADPITKLNIAIITAAEQQTMNYYMNQNQFYTSEIGRRIYQEIGLIEEQHVSLYGGLMDVKVTWLENLLNHEYTECYLYYSCYKDETHPKIKAIWEEMLVQEIAHLHKAVYLLNKYEKKDWQQVIPLGEFPQLLSFGPQKAYVREVLKQTATNTGLLETYADVNDLEPKADFFIYQGIVNRSPSANPTHQVIEQHIKQFETDYRFEESPNPREELTNRTVDNIKLGRVQSKVKVKA
ncbi:MAG TPA: hypothetical protein VJ903_01145 [Clostridia bacterium]|nr:hypothetical protein [Clostridia bacterium]